MVAYGRREPRFSDITRLRKVGSRYFAMAGEYQKVLAATYSAGLTTVVGELDVGSVPRDCTSDGSSYLYVLTDDGVTKATLADTPVASLSVAFDVADGNWIFYRDGYVVAPVSGGVRCYSPDFSDHEDARIGARSVSGAALSSEDILYVVDGVRAKIHAFRVVSGVPVYVDSFRAPNCRDIVKVELDEDNELLFVVCRHRLVSFDVPNAAVEDDEISVELHEDYGNSSDALTDFQVTPDGYWIGIDADTALNPNPRFYGSQYGVFDETLSDNGALVFACPDASWFAASSVVPVVAEDEIADAISDPEDIEVDAVVPAPPVITSSLTSSVTEDSAWTYTITATGEGPISFSSPDLPEWATLNAVTGVITGTPVDPAVVNITIVATNAGGSDTETLVLTVVASIANLSAVSVGGNVFAGVLIGPLLYIGGAFTQVTDSLGTITRNRLACLNLSTGLWTAWNPNASTTILSIATFGGWVIAGAGSSVTIGGNSFSRLARINASTGASDVTWNPTFGGGTVDALVADDKLYAFGSTFSSVNGSTRETAAAFTSLFALDPWRPAFGGAFMIGTPVRAAADAGSQILVAGSDIVVQTTGPTTIRMLGFGRINKSDATVTVYGQGGHPAVFDAKACAVDGSRDYVGGNISQIWSLPSYSATPSRTNMAAIDSGTTVAAFDPGGSAVASMYVNPDDSSVWVGRESATTNTLNHYDGSGSSLSAPTWTSGSGGILKMLRFEGALVLLGSFTGSINGSSTRTRLAVINIATGNAY